MKGKEKRQTHTRRGPHPPPPPSLGARGPPAWGRELLRQDWLQTRGEQLTCLMNNPFCRSQEYLPSPQDFQELINTKCLSGPLPVLRICFTLKARVGTNRRVWLYFVNTPSEDEQKWPCRVESTRERGSPIKKGHLHTTQKAGHTPACTQPDNKYTIFIMIMYERVGTAKDKNLIISSKKPLWCLQ